MPRRRFELVEGTSSKFWEVWRKASEVHTQYGRIGAAGQTTVKDEGTSDKAKKLLDKLVAEKTKKGYREVGEAPAKSKEPSASNAVQLAKRIAAIEGAAKAAGVALPPGASDDALRATEAKLGIALPEEVGAFYRAHDGGPRDDLACGGRELLSLDGIARQWATWKEGYDDDQFTEEHANAEPDRGVRKKWWIPQWIPVTYDFGGNHDMIDLAPTKPGKVGQIISFWHDSGERTLKGPDFLTWLAEQEWTSDGAVFAEKPQDEQKEDEEEEREPSIAETIAEIERAAKSGEPDAERRADDLVRFSGVFRAFRAPMTTYPKRLLEDLTPDQRAYLEKLVELGLEVGETHSGLFNDPRSVARYLGHAPRGPSDALIDVGGRRVPIWWAVSAVGAGHADAAAVLAGWKALPAREALAAYTEIARGHAYDVLVAHWTSEKDTHGYDAPYQRTYRYAVVSLLADVSVAFGDDGERAARALLDLPRTETSLFAQEKDRSIPIFPGAGQAFTALLSGVRHAAKHKGTVDVAYDAAFDGIWERVACDRFHSPPLIKEITKGLPRDRAATLRAKLASP